MLTHPFARIKRPAALILSLGAMGLCGLLLPAVTHAAPWSPLATADQVTLDQRATRVDQAHPFPVARLQAKAAYRLAHGLPVSAEAEARLDQAIDELAFSAVQKAVNGDPLYPKVYWLNAPPHRWPGAAVQGGRYSYDNPDNIYRTIPIEGGSRYVLKGRRFNAGPTDVTFSLISNVNSQNTIAYLTGKDLVVGADGRYEITIDADPANGRINHIQSTSAARQLFVRNNLGDWNSETPDALTVERLGPPPARAPRGDAAVALEAWANLQESIIAYGVGALGLKTHLNPVNTLSSPSTSSTLGTLVTQTSAFGHFKLAKDEALVITLRAGGAGYFVVPVTDPWMVSGDPIRRQTSLNNKQAVAESDGSYTFVVAAQDPGVHNWLDTEGRSEGTIMVRWQDLPAQPVDGGPQVSARVVRLTDLAAALPADTRWTDATERAGLLARREAGYLRRTQLGF